MPMTDSTRVRHPTSQTETRCMVDAAEAKAAAAIAERDLARQAAHAAAADKVAALQACEVAHTEKRAALRYYSVRVSIRVIEGFQ